MASINPELAAPVSAATLETWSNGLSWSIFTFSIITLIFVLVTFLIFSLGNLTEISKNFAKYRCNPLMMPFAGQFGYDAKENFDFCISNILNNKAAEIFAPLYGILSQFTGVLTIMMNATLGIRKLFSNFFLSVNNFIGNVRNRIQNLLFQIRISFLKMNNLMGRVFGTMYAVIYMGSSALTAGNNLANSDLVTFLSEFCFDPSTPVKMANGSYKKIEDIVIGDHLTSLNDTNPMVTSIFRFDGQHTSMVSINDIVVSAQHYVECDAKWIPAADHPLAIRHIPLRSLVCLNVTGNTFYVGKQGLKVRDYDETNDPGTTMAAKLLANVTLNGKGITTSDTTDTYDLGFDPQFEVYLDDNTWLPAAKVNIGAVLSGGHKVVGVVHELCTYIVDLEGKYVSSSQLVFMGEKWVRAGSVLCYKHDPKILIQFVTENCGPIFVRNGDRVYTLRDYREAAVPEMESAYVDFMERIITVS